MDEATKFLSFTFGNVTLSGFVTPQELARIEAGEVVDVLLRGVVGVHGDVGEDVSLGDLACTFIGGELSPFAPPRGG